MEYCPSCAKQLHRQMRQPRETLSLFLEELETGMTAKQMARQRREHRRLPQVQTDKQMRRQEYEKDTSDDENDHVCNTCARVLRECKCIECTYGPKGRLVCRNCFDFSAECPCIQDERTVHKCFQTREHWQQFK